MTLVKILVTGAIGSFVAAFGLEYLYRERPLGDAFWRGMWFLAFYGAGSLVFEGVSRVNERRKALAEVEGEVPSGFDLELVVQAAALVALSIMMALYARDKLVAFALLTFLVVSVVWNRIRKK